MTVSKQVSLTCSGHTRPVVCVAHSGLTSEGYFMISGCKAGHPMLRKGETGDWIGTFHGHKGAVWGATLSKDSFRAASASADYTAKVWDTVTGDLIRSLEHKHIVKSVDFSYDCKKLLTGSNEKLLKVFDLKVNDDDYFSLEGHTASIKSSLWLNEFMIISGSEDKTIRIWDTRNRAEFKQVLVSSPITSLELSRSHDLLLATYGSTIAIYNASSLKVVKTIEWPVQLNSASLHKDKSCIVAGGEDFKLYKIDYETGKELESYKGHFGPVHCVRFSPDSDLYASGSEDGTVRLWQTVPGKAYGLWKGSDNNSRTTPSIVTNN